NICLFERGLPHPMPTPAEDEKQREVPTPLDLVHPGAGAVRPPSNPRVFPSSRRDRLSPRRSVLRRWGGRPPLWATIAAPVGRAHVRSARPGPPRVVSAPTISGNNGRQSQ